jgi:hypothetical protein
LLDRKDNDKFASHLANLPIMHSSLERKIIETSSLDGGLTTLDQINAVHAVIQSVQTNRNINASLKEDFFTDIKEKVTLQRHVHYVLLANKLIRNTSFDTFLSPVLNPGGTQPSNHSPTIVSKL